MSVYFITCREIGFVKIGCAYNPFVRLSTLQTAFPLELKVEALFKGAHAREKEFHVQFSEHRVRGEWFRICPEIEALIAEAETPSRPRSEAQKRRLHELHQDTEKLGPPQRFITAPQPEEPLPPPRVTVAFDERRLSKAERKRIASGDIHFPFRAKADA